MSKEVKLQATPFFVKLQCDCGGEMIRTNTVLTMYPALYPHKCDKCDVVENKSIVYPYIEHEYLDNNE